MDVQMKFTCTDEIELLNLKIKYKIRKEKKKNLMTLFCFFSTRIS